MAAESKSLTEGERKAVFLALVQVQDGGELTVEESRRAVGSQFGVSEGQVKDIEREGLDGQWPPLGE